jgi:hypothetical protein
MKINQESDRRLDVLTGMSVKITHVWHVMLCNLVQFGTWVSESPTTSILLLHFLYPDDKGRRFPLKCWYLSTKQHSAKKT